MVLPRRVQFVSTVLSNKSLCREHYRLVLGVRSFPETDAGQFIQIACRDETPSDSTNEMEWFSGSRPTAHDPDLQVPLALLRRPFSLAGRRDTAGGVELEVIYRVIGVGTDWMSRLKEAESVNVLGPLGNRFTLPAESEVAVLVAGGVGIPPMLYLAQRLAGRAAVAFCGAKSIDLLPLRRIEATPPAKNNGGVVKPRQDVEEFARHGIATVVTTDDGSYGYRGFVTQALEQYLDHWPATGFVDDAMCVIYTCGPEPMMKRVGELALARGIECQIAVERAMACGMGTCQSCVIRVRDPREPGWAYRLACTDGPIFRGADLLW